MIRGLVAGDSFNIIPFPSTAGASAAAVGTVVCPRLKFGVPFSPVRHF